MKSAQLPLADYDDEEDDIIIHGQRGFNTDKDSYPLSKDFSPLLKDLEIDSSSSESTSSGSFYDSEAEETDKELEPYDMNSLPSHACKYCGINDPSSVAKCGCCRKWFCNGKGTGNSGTHIIQHLVRAKHREVSLHPDSAVGDSILECYHCGNKNVFLLGFIPAKADTVVVLLCRQPCATSAGGAKDATWDLGNWTPLVNQRALLSWLVSTPSDREQLRARPITSTQILKLEELWKTRPDADLDSIGQSTAPETVLQHVKLHYESAFEYHSIMSRLVHAEAEQDRASKEAQRQENVNIRWDIGLNMKRIAWFLLPTNSDVDFHVTAGDEVMIHHIASKWKAVGNIIKIPSSSSEEVAAEIQLGKNPPADVTSGFAIEFVWKSVPYDRMQHALKMLAHDSGHLEPAILNEILGQGSDIPELSIPLPKKISAPGLPELNHSQAHAVRSVLTKPISLIQGPPGTGKTVTSATIVYHLAQMGRGPILVCAPSNVAVDHLTEKIHQSGLRVVRVAAKWREDIDTSVSFLTLHSQLENYDASPELRKLILLKEELGELSAKDEKRFKILRQKAERNVLKAAQVVCTTAIGSGSPKLSGIKFSAVLLDEATQAVEPEALIPLLYKPRQIVMVGDHRQLGPVVLDKNAAKAGFNQSLFERLIILGLRPVRLQVQYRMHPSLSDFPSNMFYDGTLQNGVTVGERLCKDVDFPWPIPSTPMIFLSCIGTEEISSSGTSFLNRVEASNCEKIVTRFLKAGVLPSQIGVITPYDGQRAYIQHYMQTSGTLRKELYSEIEVASVDAFQGREKDYIILTCVRSNDTQSIGFLSDPRRLNVALTRAKYGLVILGNPKVLSRNLLWHHLVCHFKEKGVLVEGTLGNLRPSLLQLARPKPLKMSNVANFRMPTTNVPMSLPTNPAAYISADTISQSAFDTISLASYSQISQMPYSKVSKSRYFPLDDEE